jgi:hypothetical protein
MNVNLHIERLILDGLPVGSSQGTTVRAAVEAELSRLLVVHDAGPGRFPVGAVPSVSPGEIQLSQGNGPVELGQKIAGAVYGSVTSERLRIGTPKK